MGMTKSVLNTLWLTGGGLVATWFAVNPINTAPAEVSNNGTARRVAEMSPVNGVNTAELKNHHSVVLKPATRNPFEFGRAPVASREKPAAAPLTIAAAPVEMPPALSLSGIANQKGRDEARRIAIISGDGHLYLAAEGDVVAGRYRVITVGEDNVVLRDDAAHELRLALH